MTVCLVERYARLPYPDALARQQALAQRRRAGEAPDTLLLLEHPPTVTLGRNATEDELLTPREELRARGVAVIEADRGGRSTYHGPGQLVGYPILDLRAYGQDLHRYLRGLEEAIIAALREIGLRGERIEGLTGVWVGENKIAAIGIKARQWITSHGFSVNIDPDLSVMRRDIVACGIADHGVTSIAEERPGSAVTSIAEERPGSAVTSIAEERPGSAITSIAEERPGSAITRALFEPILLNCLSREFGFTLEDGGEMGIMAP